MSMKGGNTKDLYKKDGRLVMARALEEMWPKYVNTIWRFGRPQHSVNWGVFKHRLKLNDNIDLDKLPKVNNYGMKLKRRSNIKSNRLKKFYNKEK